MAQMELQPGGIKTKRKVHSFLRIDMTPMVDLGFLLITFFIFTTTMSEKKSMRLIMPTEGQPIPVKESEVLTILLGQNNHVFAYEGKFAEALSNNRIITTTYDEADGIGKLIREKQKQLQQANNINGKERLVYLIKPSVFSRYKNVIDALDETTVNSVKKYMVIDPTEEEKLFLQKKN